MKKLLFLAVVTGGLSIIAGARAGDFGYAVNGYSRNQCDSRAVYVEPSRDCEDYSRYNHEGLHEDLRADHRNFHRDLNHAHRDMHRDLRRERAYGVPEWQLRAEHREAHRDLAYSHLDGHADLREDHRRGHDELRW